MSTFHHPRSTPRRRRPLLGFTLIEAAIVTAIVGFGIVGMLQLIAAGSMANTESTEVSTAMGLASNIHEMATGVPYGSMLSKFKSYTKAPPVDTKENTINELPNWAQIVTFQYVDPNNITLVVPDSQAPATGRLTVTITHRNRLIYTTSWLVTAATWP